MTEVIHPAPDDVSKTQAEFMKDIRGILNELGVDTVSKFQTILQQTKWSVFAENVFCHADDIGKPLVLHQWQRDAIDLFQEVFYNPTGIGVRRYIQIIAPRSRGKSVLIGVANAIILIVTGGAMTGIFSPSMQQSENLMSKTKYFIENSKYGKWVLKRGKHISGMVKIFTGAQSVGMTNRSFSQAYANNEKTMRGIHLKAAFVDESARMNSHTLKGAIYPMVRRAKAPLICITTPFGRTGPAWEAFNDTKSWNTIMIPAVDKEFMSPEELQEEMERYGDDQALARQELMAEFISDENAIFKDKYFSWYYREDYYNMAMQGLDANGNEFIEDFEKCKYNPNKDYHMSADYGWSSNRSAVSIGYKDNVKYKDGSIESFIRVVYFRSWINVDPDILENEMVALMKFFHIKLFVPDGLSVGASELKRLYKRIRKERIGTKMYKTGVKPENRQQDRRKLGLITTGGGGDYSKLNIINETIRCSNKNGLRLPSDALMKMSKKEEKLNDGKQLEKEMLAFAKDVTKVGNVIFGRGVNDEPDDRVLTLMYLVFSFSKFIRQPYRNVAGTTNFKDVHENIVSSHEKSIELQSNAFGSTTAVARVKQYRRVKKKVWGR